MTIAELIEKLKEYPQDTRVVTRGYEGGVDDVEFVKETEIYLNFYKNCWYYGPHEDVESKAYTYDNYEKVLAIYLK